MPGKRKREGLEPDEATTVGAEGLTKKVAKNLQHKVKHADYYVELEKQSKLHPSID